MKKKGGPNFQQTKIESVSKVTLPKKVQVQVEDAVEAKVNVSKQEKVKVQVGQKKNKMPVQEKVTVVQSKPKKLGKGETMKGPINKQQIKVDNTKTKIPTISKNVPIKQKVQKNVVEKQEKMINKKKFKPNLIKILKNAEQDKKLVAVIISFHEGGSYDELFTSVQQKAEEGTQVLVYSCSSYASQYILEAFHNEPEDPILKTLMEHIKGVDPDCVVFNWQCCSFYGGKKFSEGKKTVFEFVKLVLDRGHMAMFSDFSLKALIAQWDEKALGPNPLVATTQYGGQFTINFDCQKLKDCPSAQLQIVGDMAAQGHCNVQGLGGTIVFGVDFKKADNQIYKLEVLTVVTAPKLSDKFNCQINGKKGPAGHVVLTYKSGGTLLVSMGHWIQLMKIDTSQKVLFEVAERQFGQQKARSMKMQYDMLGEAEKKVWISKNAVSFVQSQAPCKNMSKKAKKF